MPIETAAAKVTKAKAKAKANGSKRIKAKAKVPQTTYAKARKAAGRTAKELSQYYTDPRIAQSCIAVVRALYGADYFDTIIEPSAGEGAFSRQLGANCIALDIDPKAPGIEKADFLKWSPAARPGRCLVIGNPPFGKKAALAFLNHAASFSKVEVIALILPKIFCKKTQQNRVDKNLHLVHEEEIPTNSFTHEGKIVDVPCVFQVWERRPDAERAKHKLKSRHPDFERCMQNEADLVIRRVGAHAGLLKPLEQDWSANSNIFLRATGCSRDELKDRFARLAMAAQACNGAGGGSINMSEIVELYEEELARKASLAAAETGLAMLDQPLPGMSSAIAAKDAPVETLRTVEEAATLAVEDPAVEGVTGARDLDAQPAPRYVALEAATGRQAVAGFNAIADAADIITLTAPRSVRKMSVQNQLDPHFHLVEDTDSIAKVTGADGHVRSLPCAIQTWERRPEPRPKHALATCHADFEFCDRAEADVAIQRVGSNAGRLKTPDEAGSAQSHLFLRAVGCSPAELWSRLTAIDFDTVRHNTAAVPSIAKPEIVALYETSRGIAAAATAPDKRPLAPASGAARTPAVRHPENVTEGVAPLRRSAAWDARASVRPVKGDSVSSSTGALDQLADAGVWADPGSVLEPGACPP